MYACAVKTIIKVGIHNALYLREVTTAYYGNAMSFSLRFEQGDPVVADYNYNLHGQSKPSDKLCDASCRKETVCAVTHILSEDYVKCLDQSSEHL